MTKLKKPILILVLICFITVSSSVLPYKKVKAIAIVDDAIIFLVLTALAIGTYGVVSGNNAIGNGIDDIIQRYKDQGSSALEDDDFAKGIAEVYADNEALKDRLKYGQWNDPNNPDPDPHDLSAVEEAMLMSMLTKQGYEYGSDLYDNLYEYYEQNGSNSNIPEVIDSIQLPTSYSITRTNYWNWTESGYKSKYSDDYSLQIKLDNISSDSQNVLDGRSFYVTIPYVQPNFNPYFILTTDYNTKTNVQFGISFNFGFNIAQNKYGFTLPDSTFTPFDLTQGVYIPPTDLPPFIPPDPVLPEKLDFIPNFYNIDMSAFNGLGYNQVQIMDILKGNMSVSQTDMDAITKAAMNTYLNYLENPVSTPGTPTDPQIDPSTGQPIYGDNFVVDPNIEPNVPPDELTGQGTIIGWLKTLWNTIKFLPTNTVNLIKTAFEPVIDFSQRFWQQMEIWAHDNLYVHWVTLQNLLIDNFGQFIGFLQGIPQFLIDAPGLIGTWWTQEGLPDLQALFDPLVNPGATVPPDVVVPPTWSDFYTPIKTTIDFKFPWLFPQLDSISGFYEEPFEDIYANIKIGSVQGNYKLIDMSFLNDNKEQVKDTIRAFLMILIWLYNVSMAYKLLRGSDLLKSSITGVSGK